MTNAKSINFGPSINFSLGFAFNLGAYFNKPIPNSLNTLYPFIENINGSYSVNYDDSRKLQNLTILNGTESDTPFINYSNTINEMKVTYGEPSSVTNDNYGFKITRFVTNRFQILVYERKFISPSNGIVTIITLK